MTQQMLARIAFGAVPAMVAATNAFAADGSPVAPAPACGPAKMERILELARPGAKRVRIDCSFTLRAGQVVTKRLMLIGRRASGVRVDCRGGQIGMPDTRGYLITIRSAEVRRGGRSKWVAPRQITFENCKVLGTTIIYGMGHNSSVEALQRSSKRSGHIERVRAAAPRDITFRRMVFRSTRGPALYASPGVTRVRLIASDVLGKSRGVGIYLSAETGYHEIRNNRIMVKTDRREQIAIDGSANNQIVGNWFSRLSNGGIFLYRNCGEDGMIRHQPPQYNRIANNVFYYRRYRGPNPAIWLASRNGNRNYCGRDDGFPFGSSASNLDFARHNEIRANRIVARRPADSIRADDKPNRIAGNVFMSAEAAKSWSRKHKYGRAR